ncbi:MAG: hypothetical protein GX542_12900, partial [Rhodococcus sp.]|nr:hypothetical protein [Rhodococcus sp. (in: high G+C Gram-positive bacteria)]
LSASEEEAGFGRTFSSLSEGPAAVEGYVDLGDMGILGRGQITVDRATSFEDDLLDVGTRAALDSLRANVVDPETTLLVTSTPTPSFGARLAARLHLNHFERDLSELFGRDPHTASLPVAYHLLQQEGALERYRHILFVGAGAGPSAAATMYRVPSTTATTAGAGSSEGAVVSEKASV